MQGEASFRLLTPPEVVERWEALRALLEPAVAYCRGEVEVDDIRALVLQHRWFLFVLEVDGALVTAVTVEFEHRPRQIAMVVGFGAGPGAAPHTQLIGQTLRDFARKAGASRVTTYTQRPAIARYHERHFGAKPTYTVMEFPL